MQAELLRSDNAHPGARDAGFEEDDDVAEAGGRWGTQSRVSSDCHGLAALLTLGPIRAGNVLGADSGCFEGADSGEINDFYAIKGDAVQLARQQRRCAAALTIGCSPKLGDARLHRVGQIDRRAAARAIPPTAEPLGTDARERITSRRGVAECHPSQRDWFE